MIWADTLPVWTEGDGDYTKWRKAVSFFYFTQQDHKVICLQQVLFFKKREEWPQRWFRDYQEHWLSLKLCPAKTPHPGTPEGGSTAPVGPEAGYWGKKDYAPLLRSNGICLPWSWTCWELSPLSSFLISPFRNRNTYSVSLPPLYFAST